MVFQRANVRQPRVITADLAQHLTIDVWSGVPAPSAFSVWREPRIGAAPHDSVDYWGAKKRPASAVSALMSPISSSAENFLLGTPAMSARAS